MKAISQALCSLLLTTIINVSASTNWLSGLTFYDGREMLSGKLVFLAAGGVLPGNQGPMNATVFEYDLGKGKLQKVTCCPGGRLFVSSQAEVCCVVYREGSRRNDPNAGVFLFSCFQPNPEIIKLEQEPKTVVVFTNNVFFEIDSKVGMLDYDLEKKELLSMALPNASQWESQDYEAIHENCEEVNRLHFKYSRRGKRLKNGTDYKVGFYSIDVNTHECTWLTGSDKDYFNYKRAYRGYIYFADTDDPIYGYDLARSDLDKYERFRLGAEAAKPKIIKRFSRFYADKCFLTALSPCKRYALVRRSEAIPKDPPHVERTSSYYLVDLSNGKTRLWIKDQVNKTPGCSISEIIWAR